MRDSKLQKAMWFLPIYKHIDDVEYVHILLMSPLAVLKLITFELAAKFSRRRENPVQPRFCNAKNGIFKRLKTGFYLRSRSSPANSNAISFMPPWLADMNAQLWTHACKAHSDPYVSF